MKEFMKNKKITYNLMSFTGFKSLLIFTLLLEGPKSYEQLKYSIENHEYLHESVSIDTLRVYLNSLRKIGCKISRKSINGITYYSIDTHPFELKINENQAKSILKIYTAISKSIEISDLICLQNFFEKFSKYITNEDLKIKLKNISPLNNIPHEIINDLLYYAKTHTEIIILYNSLNSGKKNINILVDKLEITNGKLYVCGINSEHNNYSSLLVSKIIKIIGVNIKETKLNVPTLTVKYELYKKDLSNFEPLSCEKIINEDENKLIVEIKSQNKFEITQRILSLTNHCKVIEPQNFKEEIINHLIQMKEGYNFEK